MFANEDEVEQEGRQKLLLFIDRLLCDEERVSICGNTGGDANSSTKKFTLDEGKLTMLQ